MDTGGGGLQESNSARSPLCKSMCYIALYQLPDGFISRVFSCLSSLHPIISIGSILTPFYHFYAKICTKHLN